MINSKLVFSIALLLAFLASKQILNSIESHTLLLEAQNRMMVKELANLKNTQPTLSMNSAKESKKFLQHQIVMWAEESGLKQFQVQDIKAFDVPYLGIEIEDSYQKIIGFIEKISLLSRARLIHFSLNKHEDSLKLEVGLAW